MMASITAARLGHSVLMLEKLPQMGAKLKATGGGRCNLTNRLDKEIFISHFGKNGRFMTHALESFSSQQLVDFFMEIGVESHAPDGFRVFPLSHSSTTVLNGLKKELERLGVRIYCSQKVNSILQANEQVIGVETDTKLFYSNYVILATGGMGYPQLGSTGDGYGMAADLGHKITDLYPAMMPLKVREKWVADCRADTIGKATIKVNIRKYNHLSASGDLIFTKEGIRGPVVLDFSREITPLLHKYNEVPILVNLTKGMNEEDIHRYFKKLLSLSPHQSTLDLLLKLLPESVSLAIFELAGISPNESLSKQSGKSRDALYKILAWTPLHVTGHDGFKMAMVTRGGIDLKEINPASMQSKTIKGLYFCGEVINIDGPCGGYNLQWSFSSGHLAGMLT